MVSVAFASAVQALAGDPSLVEQPRCRRWTETNGSELDVPEYEVYAACEERSARQARAFLDAFLPSRRELADEYHIPELSDDPRIRFPDAATLIQHLEAEQQEEHGVYWSRDGAGDPRQAMLFFTEDGGMIAGLASSSSSPATMLRELAAVVGARYGVVVLEERPPATLSEFFSLCRRTAADRLVDGVFLPASSPDS